MSGGSFDYAYSRVEQFADALADKIDDNDALNDWGEPQYAYDTSTLQKLREIENLARFTSKLMREAEWLYSGDTSGDTFQSRVAEIEESFQKVFGYRKTGL